MDCDSQLSEVNPEDALMAIQSYLNDEASIAEQTMRESGTLSTGILEHATRLSSLLRGEQGEIDIKLLNWYKTTTSDVELQLYSLVKTYLLSAGLIEDSE